MILIECMKSTYVVADPHGIFSILKKLFFLENI